MLDQEIFYVDGNPYSEYLPLTPEPEADRGKPKAALCLQKVKT